MVRPRRGGVVMSASTIWPEMRTRAAPAAGHEAPGHEGGKGRRVRAEEIAGRRHQSAEGEGGPAPEAVGEATRGHGHEEAREPVDGDGHPDGRLRHVERSGVEGEHGHDAPEAELIDRDEHAHPDEDAVGARSRHTEP
jgi:hypothetical protein